MGVGKSAPPIHTHIFSTDIALSAQIPPEQLIPVPHNFYCSIQFPSLKDQDLPKVEKQLERISRNKLWVCW